MLFYVFHGFVYNILTCQDVVDKSVSGFFERICLRFVLDMSVGGKRRHGFVRMWHVLDKVWL